MEGDYFFRPRIVRSPLGDCWGREIQTALDVYTDGYLKKISDQGYDGIWLHVNLRETIASSLFPGSDENNIDILNRLVEKAGKHGVGVYCYLLEPRALPKGDEFWRAHPDLKGQPGRSTFAFCSSTPEVKRFLEESSFNLFRSVPGLGGAFMITASELHTHCYSHLPVDRKRDPVPHADNWAGQNFVCPRCMDRTPGEVASEIINLLNRGIKKADKKALVIAWTWSWFILEPDPQKDLISRVAKDVILMSDFERGGKKKVQGKIFPVDEYSFSYAGPSPRFKKHLALARANKLKFMAKIQISSTHELATVPYIPVPYLIAEKMDKMRKMEVDGYLGCWNFGGNISPMTSVAGIMSGSEPVSPSRAVERTAIEYFGGKSAGKVCRAWRKFSDAWKKYPFSIPLIYNGPINYAVAYPISLDAKKVPVTHAHMPLPRDEQGHLRLGDNTDEWIKSFRGEAVNADILSAAFESLVVTWDEGIKFLKDAIEVDPENTRLRKEVNLARHISLSVKSTINIIIFYQVLPTLQTAKSPVEADKTYRLLLSLFERELEHAAEDRVLVEQDEALGFHSEAHERLYTQADLDYKISVLEKNIKQIVKTIGV